MKGGERNRYAIERIEERRTVRCNRKDIGERNRYSIERTDE